MTCLRLLEQRWTITAVLSDSSLTKKSDAQTLQLKDEYWQQLIEKFLLSTLKCTPTVTVCLLNSQFQFQIYISSLQDPFNSSQLK